MVSGNDKQEGSATRLTRILGDLGSFPGSPDLLKQDTKEADVNAYLDPCTSENLHRLP